MKLFIVAAVLGVCSAARLDNAYLPPRGGDGAGYGATGSGFRGSSFGSGGSGFGSGGGFGSGNGGFGAGNAGYGAGNSFGAGGAGSFGSGGAGGYNAGSGRQSADANAQILKLNSEVTAEGFSYEYETSNGIRADASGVATNGVQSQGSFSYKGDDGQDYTITYTADENGYQPRGAHLPTPPPIPEEILKSLEQNARDEAAGIVDDGQYRGEGADAGRGGYGAQGSGYGSQGSGFGGQGSGFGGQGSGFGGQGSGFGGQGSGGRGSSFGGQGSGFNGQSSSFGGRGSGFGGQGSSFGTPSRQYLTPNAGRVSGNGNFNAQSGYRY